MCRVSCITEASNGDWLTVGQSLLSFPQVRVEVGQSLLSLQQVRVAGKCFYCFCFFTFIHFPLSPLSLSFISSTISSICLLLFSERRHKTPTRVDVSLITNIINIRYTQAKRKPTSSLFPRVITKPDWTQQTEQYDNKEDKKKKTNKQTNKKKKKKKEKRKKKKRK